MEKQQAYLYVNVKGANVPQSPYRNGDHLIDTDAVNADAKISIGETVSIVRCVEPELLGRQAVITQILPLCEVEGFNGDPTGADCPTCEFTSVCTRQGLGQPH